MIIIEALGDAASPVVFTIGHSTRKVEDFLRLLVHHGVQAVLDVRTLPGSRRNPQFNSEILAGSLRQAGISYEHLKNLGGLRRASKDSPNGAWRNASFRGFADYMQTEEFAAGLEALMSRARRERVALMCAEAVPWRCHRSLIADALSVRGVSVQHIVGEGKTLPHSLTPWARVDGLRVTYPALTPSPPETGSGRAGRP